MSRSLGKIAWRKSSYSVGDGACVEAYSSGHMVPVRDSTDVSGPTLFFDADSWASLTRIIKREHPAIDQD